MGKKYLYMYGALLSIALLAVQFFTALGQAGSLDIHTKRAVEKDGINFLENQWTAARQKAVSEHKFIFVDAYARWCGPCKLLKRTTFKDKGVAAFFNAHFINVSLDVEKGQGPELAFSWKITGLPTLIIFDAAGQPVLESMGYLPPEDLLAFARQALGKGAKPLKPGE